MIVLKFGGTSIGSPERMRRVAQFVADKTPKIVVLSAIAGTTDKFEHISRLLFSENKDAAAREISALKEEYDSFISELYKVEEFISRGHELVKSHFNYITSFTLDMFTPYEEKALLAQGELLSTAMFQLYLEQQGVESRILPALQFMRIDEHSEPNEEYIKSNINKLISTDNETGVYITQGYICRNSFGEIDNLKRGGSDYSATLIGAAIDAEEIRIWKDIDGLHNNDPRYVKDTYPLNELSYEEAAELAYFGAKILHPSSVLPAQKKSIPIRLKHTMNPEATGTLISSKTFEGQVKAVVAKDGITAIKIRSGRMLLAYGFLRRVFEIFESYKTPIDMITTSEVAVSLTIDDDSNLVSIVSDLKKFGDVEVDINQTIICLVGDFLADNRGYAAKIFDALSKIPIRMISYGGSKHNISVLVGKEYKIEALQVLNDKVFGKRTRSKNDS